MALKLLSDSPRASSLRLLNPAGESQEALPVDIPAKAESPAIEQMKAATDDFAKKNVASQFDQMAQETLKLQPEQRNASINSPILDTITGGMNLSQADANAKAQIDRYKNIPKEVLDIGKTLTASGMLNPGQPQSSPMDLLDAVGKTAGVAATPFIPAAGGIEGILKGFMTGQNPATTAIRGMVDPASAPMLTSPENVPLMPFERQGGVAPLIPRAILQGVEQYLLGLGIGAPDAIGKAVEGAKVKGVSKDFESTFAKIDPKNVQDHLEAQGLFPKEMPVAEKADMTTAVMAHLKESLKANPAIGDYFIKQQTLHKLARDAEMSLREGLKTDIPLKPGERGSTGVPDEQSSEVAKPNEPAQPEAIQPPKSPDVPAILKAAIIGGQPSTQPPPSGQVSQPIDTEKYKENLKSLRRGNVNSAHIGDIPPDIAQARGIPSEVHIDWKAINKIKDKHSVAVDNNFIDNLNNADSMIFPKNDPAVINFVKKMPSGKDFLIATRRFNGHFVVTGFEPARADYIENKKKNGEVINLAGRPLGSSIETPIGASQQELSGVSKSTSPSVKNISQENQPVKSPEDIWDMSQAKEQLNIDDAPNIHDKAEMELEMMAEGNVHPLEKAMKKIGGVKFGDIEENIPRRFRGKKASDEAMQELSNNYGIEFKNDSEFQQALKTLGDAQMRFGLSDDVQTFLKSKENVDKIGKKLEQKLGPGKVKRIVHSYVGVKKPKSDILIQTTEQQVLKHMMKVREKASKEGFEAGRVQGRKAELEKRKTREEEKSKAIEEAKRFTKEQRKELYQRAFSKGLIIKTEDGKVKDRFQGILRYYKKASFDEIMNYLNALNGEQGNPPAIFKISGDVKKDTEIKKLIDEVSGDWQDINRLEIGTLDLPRIVEKITGSEIFDNNILADNTYEVLKGADDARFEKMNEMLKDLAEKIKGVHEDTKVSADLMKNIESGDQSVEKERKYFHEIYDSLIKMLNENRVALGKKPIEYRRDYFTHIRESNLLNDFFKGDNREIDKLTNDQLKALSKGEYAKISVPFNKFAQKREGNRTKYDAIGNFKKYLETALYEIYMSPAIKHARTFTDYALLRPPNAKISMDMLFNELAGKPSQIDNIFLRPIVSNKFLKALNSRFGGNALVGNISYMLTNASNIGTASGELGRYTIKGMHAFLSNKELRQLAFKESSILKSRKSLYDSELAKVDAYFGDSWKNLTWWENVKLKDRQFEHILTSLNRIIEYNNVGSSWVGAYLKAIDKFKFSPEKAYKYADSIARKTQGGYRPYEVPAYMRSDTGKLFSKFGTWSFNMMNYFLYDLGGANIPKNIISPITKAPGGKVKYSTFLILVGTLLFMNAMYKKAGLREPYNPQSFMPQTPLNRGRYQEPPMGKIVNDATTLVTGGEGKKEETKNKARAKAAKEMLFMLGPRYGGAQIGRIMSGNILPKTEEKKSLKLLL